jgi:UDP-N-acetyl-D-galactosamine dehydrogenase
LGYVGLPLAVELSKYFSVIGFDVKPERINELKNGFDRTREVDVEKLLNSKLEYTTDPAMIKWCKFIIVAVPTPVDINNLPDLFLVEKATEMVGKNLSSGSIVVYESTVYPGVTEDFCVPILERESGLKFGVDFTVGYSPERINPGDKEHSINNVVKIVSATDELSLRVVSGVYSKITKIFEAKSIKVAEAAKVIENTQRDVNVALMNELAVIFNKLGISTYDVLAAAGTKWNFLKFTPGLVGGHCIGVDPYYLTYKSQQIGYNPEVILSGRRINDNMANWVVTEVAKKYGLKNLKVSMFGVTFKENVPDSRNSKAVDIIRSLEKNGAQVQIYDPLAYHDELLHEYNLKLTNKDDLSVADVLFLVVAHDIFKDDLKEIKKFLKPGGLVVDIKNILNKEEIISLGFNYWTL